MAHRRLPLVSEDRLRLLDEAAGQLTSVLVGSNAWYTWLAAEQNRSFSFRNHLGAFTVRCERKRHDWYWYVYRKRGGKLRKAYLGKTEEVTLERLNAVATALADQGDVDNRPEAYLPYSGGSVSQNPIDITASRERRLAAATSTFPHPSASGQAIKHNLPTQPTPLIGREQEIAAACALLRHPEVRLLTLTGTGGVGKTRLGLQAATDVLDDFADGVYFVELASISNPTLVVPTIAQVFGLKEEREQALLDFLKASLRDKHLLLLLDNFEQVVEAASQLSDLLAVCLHLKLLVTSRAVLHVRGEHEFPVSSLALPDLTRLPEFETLSQYAAVALFLQCVRTAKPDFQMAPTNARTIAEICIRLDGLPLAIELAAARIKLLPPQALLTRLEHRLAVLTSGAQDLPVRHQALRNTIAWSYDLLSAEEQWLFRHLSVFVNGCTLQALEAVCAALSDGTVSLLDAVTSLMDKSLLQVMEQEGEPRLRLLETIREYGLECLTANGEVETTRQAHALCYLALAEEAEPKLGGPEQIVWLERLEWEHDNLRAAWHWLIE